MSERNLNPKRQILNLIFKMKEFTWVVLGCCHNLFKVLKFFGGHGPFCEATDTPGTSGNVCAGFQNQGGSLACVLLARAQC